MLSADVLLLPRCPRLCGEEGTGHIRSVLLRGRDCAKPELSRPRSLKHVQARERHLPPSVGSSPTNRASLTGSSAARNEALSKHRGSPGAREGTHVWAGQRHAPRIMAFSVDITASQILTREKKKQTYRRQMTLVSGSHCPHFTRKHPLVTAVCWTTVTPHPGG